jgi:hypothetical protein
MNLEYPYQLVAFLEDEPVIGESVYYGKNGWFPQIALKRRFKAVGIEEDELLDRLAAYCSDTPDFIIQTKDLIQPDRMPVKMLEVEVTPELVDFHSGLIAFLGEAILSRHPERDGRNYLPHITAEFNGQMVIDHEKYSDREFLIDKVFLLKDVHDENSIAHVKLFLK